MRPNIFQRNQANNAEVNQPADNVQMSDLELCDELAEIFDKNMNDAATLSSNKKYRGIVNASFSVACLGVTASLLGLTVLTAGVSAPITLPAAGINLAIGVRGLREAIRPELLDKRITYTSMLRDLIGKNTGILMPIPGTELSRAKENLKLLVKIGKGEENEDKIKTIPRVFINKLKTGFAKLKENEAAAEAAVNDRATTNPLHNVPLNTTQRQSGTSSLNPNPNQNQESNSGEENPTPSGESKNSSITSLNPNQNQQNRRD